MTILRRLAFPAVALAAGAAPAADVPLEDRPALDWAVPRTVTVAYLGGDKPPHREAGRPSRADRKAAAMPALRPIAADAPDALPPGKPGECYVRVYRPAKMKTVREKVMVTPATTRLEATPARFEEVEEKVLVRPETKRYEIVPAEYRTEKTTVTVVPAYETLSPTAPKFGESKRSVVTVPARTEWRKGGAPLSKLDGATGEVWCLVRVPEETTEVTVSKLLSDARMTTQHVKAETKEVETQVLVKAASVKEVSEPAVYKTVTVRKLVEPAGQRRVPVPAHFKTVERQVVETPAALVWRRVLCDTNVSEDLIKRLERRLKKAGHDPGAVDGHPGPATMKAVEAYQKEQGLPVGGLTYEVLEKLGVKP